MAIAAYFNPPGLTRAQFDEVHRRLTEVGQGSPDGRLHHSCFGEDGSLMVFEVWESPQKFEAFGAVLMPILGEVGIDPGTPAVMPVVRVDQAAATIG
jgi:hypothetical protein